MLAQGRTGVAADTAIRAQENEEGGHGAALRRKSVWVSCHLCFVCHSRLLCLLFILLDFEQVCMVSSFEGNSCFCALPCEYHLVARTGFFFEKSSVPASVNVIG